MMAGPWPCPCPPASVIHGDSDRADQAHSRSTLTLTVPVPPPAGMGEPPPLSDTPHRSIDEGATLVFEEFPPQPERAISSATAGGTVIREDRRRGRRRTIREPKTPALAECK